MASLRPPTGGTPRGRKRAALKRDEPSTHASRSREAMAEGTALRYSPAFAGSFVTRRLNLFDGDTHMTRALAATLVGVLVLVCSPLAQSGGGRLQISWIDVEGGASTLFKAPNGQSLLFDTGFPGNDDRDAKRIAAAAKAMGLTRIDDVVISHWHGDHVSGLPALAKLIPIGTFYDHGDGDEQADRPMYEGYKV